MQDRWYKSSQVNMSFHSNTLFWFPKQSVLFLLLNVVTWRRSNTDQFHSLWFYQPKMEYTIYCNRCEHTNLYNNEMGFLKGRITLREHLSSPRFLVGSVFLIFLVFCVSVRSECRVVMSVTISAWERCSVCLYLLLFVRGHMSYLHCLFVWA
jgi:hypothetical protein